MRPPPPPPPRPAKPPPAASLPAPHPSSHRRGSTQPVHPSGKSRTSRSLGPPPAPTLHQTQSTHRPDAPPRTSASGPLRVLQVRIFQVRILEQQLRRGRILYR